MIMLLVIRTRFITRMHSANPLGCKCNIVRKRPGT